MQIISPWACNNFYFNVTKVVTKAPRKKLDRFQRTVLYVPISSEYASEISEDFEDKDDVDCTSKSIIIRITKSSFQKYFCKYIYF